MEECPGFRERWWSSVAFTPSPLCPCALCPGGAPLGDALLSCTCRLRAGSLLGMPHGWLQFLPVTPSELNVSNTDSKASCRRGHTIQPEHRLQDRDRETARARDVSQGLWKEKLCLMQELQGQAFPLPINGMSENKRCGREGRAYLSEGHLLSPRMGLTQ